MSPPLLSIEAARALAIEVAEGRLGTEVVSIDEALDRVLAADVVAAGDVPSFRSSAMDGFALSHLGAAGPLQVIGESRAGQPFEGALADGEAIRISTGAMVPDAGVAVVRQEDVVVRQEDVAVRQEDVVVRQEDVVVRQEDVVVRQEDVVSAGGTIEVQVMPPRGENIRLPGEDMRAGQVILTSGTRLGAAELGAGVAAGAGQLTVARRPTVSILCTGDELRDPGEPLGPGEIHNSNGPMLRALAIHSGAQAGPAGHLADDQEASERALGRALSEADVVIVSGGVSVGPHDHVKPALANLGVTEHFWRVALQPGKPTWFGSRDRKLVFALPGNPVSAAVTFSLFARPALDVLLGASPHRLAISEARLGVPVRRNPLRDQAMRVRLEIQEDTPLVFPTGAQDSHLFTSLLRADCLAIVPSGEGELPEGTRVRLEPLPE